MANSTIRENISHAHPVWCYYGKDIIPFTLPMCLEYKTGALTILQTNRGDAQIVSEPEAGTKGDMEIAVEWRHGFFGNVSYKLEVESKEAKIEGVSIFFKSVDVQPDPIKPGKTCSLTITLRNCGSERLKSKYDPPKADFIFSIKELEYLNSVTGEPTGEIIRISDHEGLDAMFSFRAGLDIGHGEDFTVTREKDIPEIAALAGTYRTEVYLESIDMESPAPDTLLALSNPLAIRIEP